MKGCFIGRVSASDDYKDKTTGELVGSVSVASGKNMVGIRCANYSEFHEDDRVIVFGDIIANGREFFVKDASVRMATDTDAAFMAGEVGLKFSTEGKAKAA